MTRLVDGWLAKSAPGVPFRRASAVLPPLGAAEHPERATAVLDELQRWYDRRDQRLLVQVSTADPEAHLLDALLDARGMVVEAPVEVMTASVAVVNRVARRREPGKTTIEVETLLGVDVEWAERHSSVHGDDRSAKERVEAYGRMLEPLGPGTLEVVARRSGELAGIGFAVVERGWVGLFGMGTAVPHQRRGVAGAVLAALVDAGRTSGASAVYLQVERENGAARALYEQMGFAPSHRYHYRSTCRGL